MRRSTIRLLLAVLAVLSGFLLAPRVYALGGPVVIGGDDADDHGSFSNNANRNGWLYIEDAFNNIGPAVRNGNRVAVCIGCNTFGGGSCSGSTAANAFRSGFDLSDLPGLGWTRVCLEATADITGFFDGNGVTAIDDAGMIYMPTDGGNVSGGINVTQIGIVNANAAAINGFVAGGGGLFAHDQGNVTGGFGWLTTLLPGLVHHDEDEASEEGCNDDALHLTGDGQLAFPQLNDTIASNATPWHGFFTGNFGGLDVLMTGPCESGDQAVVIGGAQVVLQQLIALGPELAVNPPGTSHTVTASVENDLGEPVVGSLVTFTVQSGPNAGDTGAATTDAAGHATFSYLGDGGIGLDEIGASFFDTARNEVVQAVPAVKIWDRECNANATPDSCDASCEAFDGACDTLFSETCGGSVDADQDGIPDECDPCLGINTAGAPCDDGDACTLDDTCDAQDICSGMPVVCTALDECHVPGTCDPATGLCSDPPASNGTPCEDGNLCNGVEICVSGACMVPTAEASLACVAGSRVAVVSNFADGTATLLNGTPPSAVPVGESPWGVGVDPLGNHGYVTSRETDTVTAIDLATGTTLGTIPVGRLPLGVALDPPGTQTYVTSYNDDTITVIDSATHAVVGNMPAGAGPAGVVFNPAGTRAYVANYAGDVVSAIDRATGGIVAQVSVGTQPLGMDVDRVRNRLYVTNFASNTVSVLGLFSNRLLVTIPVGRRPFGIAVDSVAGRAYVANSGDDTITVIDTGGNTRIGSVPVGRAPFGVDVDGAGAHVYVANNEDATVSIIDIASGAVSEVRPSGGLPVAFGHFVSSALSTCGAPQPVCDDNDPFTADSCVPATGCVHTLLAFDEALRQALDALRGLLDTAPVGALGNERKMRRLEQLVEQTQNQAGITSARPLPSVASTLSKTDRKRLKRGERRLRRFARLVRGGIRRKKILRDTGWRLLDLALGIQNQMRAARGKPRGTVRAPGDEPAPVSVRRRPAPPLPL